MTSLTTPTARPAAPTAPTGSPASATPPTGSGCNALDMGEVQGQGYIGQALGVADVLAVVYTDQLRYRPEDPHWAGPRPVPALHRPLRHRALRRAGRGRDHPGRGAGDLRLRRAPGCRCRAWRPTPRAWRSPAARWATASPSPPGWRSGLRHQGNPARVYNLLSDGELDEGSTWEAALQAAHHGLDNVTAIVDVNALQADGPTAGVLRTEPVTDKWRAFGWHALRVDGNDIAALVDAFDELAPTAARPAVLICDTRIGRGVPLLETREKAHFMRVAEHEWQIARDQLPRKPERRHR